jgi:hypothetical protein
MSTKSNQKTFNLVRFRSIVNNMQEHYIIVPTKPLAYDIYCAIVGVSEKKIIGKRLFIGKLRSERRIIFEDEKCYCEVRELAYGSIFSIL